MNLFNSIMWNLGRVCMLFGLMSAFFVVFSWLAGYWLNGLYGMHFQIDSCWQGVSACGMGLVGLLKWLIDSAKNSPMGEPPAGAMSKASETAVKTVNTVEKVVNKLKGCCEMKVFLNPGHAPNGNPDPGACGNGLRECDIAKEVADLVEKYLVAAGVEVVENLQSDNLYYDGEGPCVVEEANACGADIFVSIHCNSATPSALGTETLCYADRGNAGELAHCIQDQIINSLGTVDRGVKERPGLVVLRMTDMPAVLVELAFISNEGDAALLANDKDEFARAIARGITDYECM